MRKNKLNVIYFGRASFEVQTSFCPNGKFLGTFVDFFVMFTQILMKKLQGVLIYVHKIFNCRVSFKMLLPKCLVIQGIAQKFREDDVLKELGKM